MSKKRRPSLRLEEFECRITPDTTRTIGTFEIVDKTIIPNEEWASGAVDLAGSVIGTHTLGASIDVSYTLTGKELTMAKKIGDTVKGELVEWRNVGIKVSGRDRLVSGVVYNLAIPKDPTFPVTGVIRWPGDTHNNDEVAPGTATAKYHAFLVAHKTYGANGWTSQIQLTSAAANVGGTPDTLRATSENVFISELYSLDSPALPTLAAGQRYRIVTFDAVDEDTFTFSAANPTDLGLFAASSDTLDYDDEGRRMLDLSTTLDGVYPAGSAFAGMYSGTNKDLVARDADGKEYLLRGYAYSAVPPGLTSIADGQTVELDGDLVEEGDDALWLTFESSSGGAGFVIIPDSSSGPLVSISDETETEGNSGTTNATFTVTLSAASSSTITVAYSTSAGTASSSSDFTSTSGTLTFDPYETSQTIDVPISGDETYELGEDFFINLGSPTNASIADGVGVGTITNDDSLPSLSFVTAFESAAEEGGAFTITVMLSNPSSQIVTVNFSTWGGTATAGSDYAATSGTLTFNPGETSKTFDILIYNDMDVEGSEGFYLTFSDVDGATLPVTSQLWIEIMDDDFEM